MSPYQDALPQKTYWKRCSTCKKEIPFGGKYHLCSVSTCRRKTTGLIFCCVSCWDAHLGFANHRSSYAEEAMAPSFQSHAKDTANIEPQNREAVLSEKPLRRIMLPSKETASLPSPHRASKVETDTLVVVSKIKNLIREQSDFNTSQCAIDALTKKVIDECLKAIEHARASERRTVMGRDVV
jgi:histone H3/H4